MPATKKKKLPVEAPTAAELAELKRRLEQIPPDERQELLATELPNEPVQLPAAEAQVDNPATAAQIRAALSQLQAQCDQSLFSLIQIASQLDDHPLGEHILPCIKSAEQLSRTLISAQGETFRR